MHSKQDVDKLLLLSQRYQRLPRFPPQTYPPPVGPSYPPPQFLPREAPFATAASAGGTGTPPFRDRGGAAGRSASKLPAAAPRGTTTPGAGQWVGTVRRRRKCLFRMTKERADRSLPDGRPKGRMNYSKMSEPDAARLPIPHIGMCSFSMARRESGRGEGRKSPKAPRNHAIMTPFRYG